MALEGIDIPICPIASHQALIIILSFFHMIYPINQNAIYYWI